MRHVPLLLLVAPALGLTCGQAGEVVGATGRIGSLLGSVKVASAGTQNHRFSPGEIEDRFVELFGYRI